MSERAQINLTQLSPADECRARVALANTPDDRLRLGLSAILGAPDGSAVVVNPSPSAEDAPTAEPETPGF